MEIIARGELPSEKLYQKTCHICKTIFRFKYSEARSSQERDRGAMFIDCPVCSAVLSVTSGDLYKPTSNYITSQFDDYKTQFDR